MFSAFCTRNHQRNCVSFPIAKVQIPCYYLVRQRETPDTGNASSAPAENGRKTDLLKIFRSYKRAVSGTDCFSGSHSRIKSQEGAVKYQKVRLTKDVRYQEFREMTLDWRMPFQSRVISFFVPMGMKETWTRLQFPADRTKIGPIKMTAPLGR